MHYFLNSILNILSDLGAFFREHLVYVVEHPDGKFGVPDVAEIGVKDVDSFVLYPLYGHERPPLSYMLIIIHSCPR